MNWNRTKKHTSLIHWYKCFKNHHLLLNSLRCSWGLLWSGILCKSLRTTWSCRRRTCWVPCGQGAGCRAEQPGCVGEVESSLSGAFTSPCFGRIWKGLLHYDGAFGDLFSMVLPYSPSPLHWNLSSAQPISFGTSAASGTAERMHLTLVWPSAAVPVLLQHPWMLLGPGW